MYTFTHLSGHHFSLGVGGMALAVEAKEVVTGSRSVGAAWMWVVCDKDGIM